jgi:hypothetical protein
MTAVLSLVYLASAVLVAAVLGNAPGIRRMGLGPAGRCATATLLFFAALFAPFYLLGMYELATDQAVITTAHAAAILVPAAVILLLGQRKPGWQQTSAATVADRTLVGDRTGRVGRFLRDAPLAGAVGATFVLATAVLSCMFPRGFESSAYHLPVGVHIFQSRSLKIWDTAVVHTYAANASLYFGFLLNFLPERVVSLANLVFLPGLAAATYETSRCLSAAPRPALVAALAMVTVPIVSFSATELEASVGAVTFLAIGIMYAVRPGGTKPWQAALTGLALGLAYGFKPVHLPAIGLVGLIFAIRCWVEDRRLKSTVGLVLLSLALTTVGAGHLLLRNQLQLSNPLYPMQLPVVSKVMGWAKAPDVSYSRYPATTTLWTSARWEWALYPWTEAHVNHENYKHSSGFGPIFAVACVPAFVTVLVGLASRRISLTAPASLLALGGGTVIGVWWALVATDPAYVVGAIAFLTPLAAWCASLMGKLQQRLYLLLLSLGVTLMLFVFASKLLIEFGDKIVLSRQWARHDYYLYPAAVDKLPEGSCVMNVGRRPWNYPAFGARLANRVVCFEIGVLGPPPRTQDSMDFDRGGELTPVTLDPELIREAGVTHILTCVDRPLSIPPSLELHEIARLDTNPHDGTPYEHAPVLYKVTVREPHEANSAQ